ncbi:MAG: HPr family phosphocarrier protein [Candidatus Fermentibacteraceae bacterium]
MKTRTLTVPNKLGIHARPAALIVRKASEYRSEVFISNGVDEVNAKSIMGVMTLAAAGGTRISISTDGPDEDSALEGVCAVIETGFGEEML